MTDPRVVSLNVGAVREVEWRGHIITSGIWKSPVSHRLELRGVNFIGDDQADRTVHGGRNKAVYAYAQEDYEYWHKAEGIAVTPGLFGENLTTEGISLTSCVVGERWRVGSALLEVAQPRLPCFKLGMRMQDPEFPKRFQRALRPGAYLRIISEGDVGASDAITVLDQPAHGITLQFMVQSLDNRAMASMLLNVPDLPPFWERVARGRGGD